MNNTSPQVDAYIAQSADFAQPILTRIRKAFHRACPQIEETIKWGAPHFERNGLVAGMAAFQQHVSFGFWKGKQLSDPHGLFQSVGKTGMCAVKLATVRDLPPAKVLTAYITEAVALNEADKKSKQSPRRGGGTAARTAAKAKKAPRKLDVPDYFLTAVRRNKEASATFEKFSYTNRKDYVEWVTGAKQQATRDRRLAQAIAWMAEGKPRNWKYMNC